MLQHVPAYGNIREPRSIESFIGVHRFVPPTDPFARRGARLAGAVPDTSRRLGGSLLRPGRSRDCTELWVPGGGQSLLNLRLQARDEPPTCGPVVPGGAKGVIPLSVGDPSQQTARPLDIGDGHQVD